jgi:RNA polymerase sigma-70 factor (ECF subfamily)
MAASATPKGIALAGDGEQVPAQVPASRPAVPSHAAFAELVEKYEARMRKLAHRLLGWRSEAVDDVVQDVFLAALDHADRFRGEASIETWLTRVTINRCRTAQRRAIFWRQWIRVAWRGANSRASDATALADEVSTAVRAAVHKLKPRDREVIVLFYLEDLPIAQIADLLGCKAGAIEVRLHRARLKLRTMLANFSADE